MKDLILLTLTFVLVLFLGCDYTSVLILDNRSFESIRVKIEGDPLEVFGTMRLIETKEDLHIYELDGESEHMIIELINSEIDEDNIPFEHLEIIANSDTIRLESKSEIFREMTYISKNYYSIIVE